MNRSLEESRGTDFFGILNVGGDYRYRADFLSESDDFRLRRKCWCKGDALAPV